MQFSIAPVLLALAGILAALLLYKKESERPAKIAASLGGLYRLVYHKFYIDELYLFVTRKIVFNLVGKPAAWIDKHIVDGMVNGTGSTTEFIAEKIKGMQSGKVQQYSMFFFVALIGLIVLFMYVIK